MIFDHIDRLCYSMSIPTHNVKKSTSSPDKMNNDSTPTSTPTKNIQNITILGNPFGPVVGHMKHIYSLSRITHLIERRTRVYEKIVNKCDRDETDVYKYLKGTTR